MAEMYGFHVGKYTNRPMDPSWDIVQVMILQFYGEKVASVGMMGFLQTSGS